MKGGQTILLTREFATKEAVRYLDNAKHTLHKSSIEYGRYKDSKYVREAAGIAYLAALKAIDGYLVSKGVPKDKLPESIEEYWVAMKKHIPLNGKLYAPLSTVYENLHLFAYYREGTDVNMIKSGLENCKKIIEMLSKTK